MSFKTEDRYDLAVEAELCLRCLQPFQEDDDYDHDCSRGKYSCLNKDCSLQLHLLVCIHHLDENVPVLEELKREAEQSYQMEMAFTVNSSIAPWSLKSAKVSKDMQQVDMDNNNLVYSSANIHSTAVKTELHHDTGQGGAVNLETQ